MTTWTSHVSDFLQKLQLWFHIFRDTWFCLFLASFFGFFGGGGWSLDSTGQWKKLHGWKKFTRKSGEENIILLKITSLILNVNKLVCICLFLNPDEPYHQNLHIQFFFNVSSIQQRNKLIFYPIFREIRSNFQIN